MQLNHRLDFARWRAIDLEPKGYRPESFRFKSLGIQQLIEVGKRGRGLSLLNLGTLQGKLVDLIAPYHPTIVSFDPGLEVPLSYFLDSLAGTGYQFDQILCWDTLMYVTPKEQHTVHDLLLQLAHNQTYLQLLTPTRGEMPAERSKIQVLPEFEIEMEPVTSECLPTAQTLPKGWGTHRALQLRNSFRELILIPKPD